MPELCRVYQFICGSRFVCAGVEVTECYQGIISFSDAWKKMYVYVRLENTYVQCGCGYLACGSKLWFHQGEMFLLAVCQQAETLLHQRVPELYWFFGGSKRLIPLCQSTPPCKHVWTNDDPAEWTT